MMMKAKGTLQLTKNIIIIIILQKKAINMWTEAGKRDGNMNKGVRFI